MTRFKAFGIHLIISAFIGAAALIALYYVFFPHPFFSSGGADRLVMILLAVDLAIGPLLTLVVFKPGKKSLKFDLAVICALQIGALVYGLHVMWVARPVYLVSDGDRFVLVRASDIDPADFSKAKAPYNTMPFYGPKLVSLRKPATAAESNDQMNRMLAGKMLEAEVFMFGPVEEGAERMKKYARPLSDLAPVDAKEQAELAEWRNANPSVNALWVPVTGKQKDALALIKAENGQYLGSIAVDGWRYWSKK
jgi:hypothetical protein